jgi:hypothetical protein
VTGVPDRYTFEMATARAQRADQSRAAGEALLYAVCDAASERLLGAIDLRFNPLDAAITEVAYMLGAPHRGGRA